MQKPWPVILAGGEGEDLWPLSRRLLPKPFLEMGGSGSLFRQACQRMQRLDMHPPMIVTDARAWSLAREELLQLGLLGKAQVILEPVSRGTGPAAMAAAMLRAARERDGLVLVLPCDHVLRDDRAFMQSLQAALPAAERGDVVLFGVPVKNTMARGRYMEVATEADGTPWPVVRLMERLPLARIHHMAQSERHWRSTGIVLARADVLLQAFRKIFPKQHDLLHQSLRDGWRDGLTLRPATAYWQRLQIWPLVSEVLQATRRLHCQPLEAGWQDVGDWRGAHELLPQDENGNAQLGPGLFEETENALIWNAGGPLVAMAGLRDVIAVSTADAVLVADAERPELVARLAKRLARSRRPEAERPQSLPRSWGWHRQLLKGQGFELNLLQVRPQGALSLRRHTNRLLIWILIDGHADVVIGERLVTLQPGESVSIPLETLHRLENPGPGEALVLELRFGQLPPSRQVSSTQNGICAIPSFSRPG